MCVRTDFWKCVRRKKRSQPMPWYLSHCVTDKKVRQQELCWVGNRPLCLLEFLVHIFCMLQGKVHGLSALTFVANLI